MISDRKDNLMFSVLRISCHVTAENDCEHWARAYLAGATELT